MNDSLWHCGKPLGTNLIVQGWSAGTRIVIAVFTAIDGITVIRIGSTSGLDHESWRYGKRLSWRQYPQPIGMPAVRPRGVLRR